MILKGLNWSSVKSRRSSASSTLGLLEASLSAIHVLGSLSHLMHHRGSSNRSTEHLEAQNTYGLPDGEEIAARLRVWFRKQRRAVLASIPKDGGPLPIHLVRLQSREWIDPMASEMVPLLRPYWSDAYRAASARLARHRDFVDLGVALNPHLRAQIERQSFNFCRSTNESTSRRLEEALEALKLEFIHGLVERGETGRELARRVKSIFDGLTDRHATTIAVTEASRAIHAAQVLAAQESGVVAGKELLISADACELCQMIATEAKMVRLDQPFAIVGDHAEYSTVMHPPLHVNCRCSMIDVLLPEYGGPADVEWGLTIFHPEDTLEGGYEPPRGLEVPEPEPERLEGRPNGRAVGDALTVQYDPVTAREIAMIELGLSQGDVVPAPDNRREKAEFGNEIQNNSRVFRPIQEGKSS